MFGITLVSRRYYVGIIVGYLDACGKAREWHARWQNSCNTASAHDIAAEAFHARGEATNSVASAIYLSTHVFR